MLSRREICFEKSMPYHVLSRTVEGREAFAKEEDCLRFIFQIYAANVGRPGFNLHRQDTVNAGRALLNNEEIHQRSVIVEHPPLVNFLSFALVGNHYHFLLAPNNDKGIPKFMQKLNGGYAKHFNLKYNRTGNLFEKPYKVIPIKTIFQLDAVICYINLINPLDVYQPGWRKNGLDNRENAFKFLKKYQFSSLLDLFEERNSKILAPHQVLEQFLPGGIAQNQEEYSNFIKDFLEKKSQPFGSFFLEPV